MPWRLAIRVAAIASVLALPAVAAGAQPFPITLTSDRAADLAGCLSGETGPEDRRDPVRGMEVVLLPDQILCAQYFAGHALVKAPDPASFDLKSFCGGANRNDKRRLPADIVKQLVGRKEIKAIGIRLLGAAFCDDEVNLRGLDLPYPLTLDDGLFRFGINATGLHVHGGFSVNNSLVFQNLTLTRASIDQSIGGHNSYISNFVLRQGEVGASIDLTGSVLLGWTVLDRTSVGGQVSYAQSALSYFYLAASKVSGNVDLTGSQARCAYRINNNDQIGGIVIDDAGFGSVVPGATATAPPRYAWRADAETDAVKRLLSFRDVAAAAGASETCSDVAPPVQFQILNDQTKALCIVSFHWPVVTPGVNAVPSRLSLTGTSVAGDLTIALQPRRPGASPAPLGNAGVLEAVAVNARALALDFNDASPYATYLDDLRFDRVASAEAVRDCKGDASAWARLPVRRVASWLGRNISPSLQPYLAFTKSFENVGVDATDLKVDKAAIEWHRGWREKNEEAARAWEANGVLPFLWTRGFRFAADYLGLLSNWVLGVIVDYGYRPAKVVWSVVGVVVGGLLVFWLLLRVIAFKSAGSPDIRLVGLTFVFDHLIPAYKIREDNYQIDAFYARGRGPSAATTQKTLFLGHILLCHPASDFQRRAALACLAIIKAIGFILAAFVVAAINALIRGS